MKRIIAWFAQNHVAANLLMALLVVGGIASLPLTNQKSFPDLEIDVISIGVPFLGATPEEVEEGVCVRIEEEIQGLSGVEKITSSAAEGNCGVSAELIAGYPIDRALAEIKNEVDSITTFPEDTERPVVSHFEIRRNALQIALSGDLSERALKIFGERVRDEISALEGVTQVELAAARPYEISIEVPEDSLRRHGISFDDVVRAVSRGSLDRPGGSIKTAAGEVLLRTKGQAYLGHEFEEIVVLTRPDGTRLMLSDVANVVDGFDEEEVSARFNGEPAVLITVYRVGDQKVLELVETVKAYVEEARLRLPDGVSLTVWRDGSEVLRDRLRILLENGRTGFLLVFVLLALFLRLRLAFWVSIGVPIAFAGALAMFPILDISIDVISLFAFILVLGILVDDAVVIGENVHRHQEKGEDPLQSAIQGAQEVAIPVIFGVLTTVVAFMPMILSPGPFGQVFGAIGLVVIVCLFLSLVESQLVLPAHLGHMKLERGEAAEAKMEGDSISARWRRLQAQLAGSLERFADRVYRPALGFVLEWRYATLATGVAVLAFTVAYVGTGRMKFSFFPPVESDYVSARLVMPLGTPASATAQAVAQLEAAAIQLQAQLEAETGAVIVENVFASVGQQPSSSGGRPTLSGNAPGDSHLGEVSIELLGGDVRPLASKEVARRWRELTPEIPDVDELVYASDLFSVGDPIDLQLSSPDVKGLEEAAERLKSKLAEYPGVFDITDSFQSGKREIKLSLLPTAEPLGITLDDLSSQVRQAFYGEEAQRIQRGRDDIRVMVRYPRSQRRSLEDLQNLRIRAPGGGEVPFYAVAKADYGRGFATIKRADRSRVINVTADVDQTKGNANAVLADLSREFLPKLLVDHPGLRFDLEGEQREQQKTLKALLRNFGFALVVIYALLAVPLRSYGQPFIIMAVIPFGIVGAIFGHRVMSAFAPALGNLSMMSVFGVIALSGVVVNASLVLVHYINTCRARGLSVREAVCEAGVARFRPIVLTAITTFAGLAPLLTEGSLSAQFLIPMATSLAFGVIFAAVISLLLVPASYLILEDLSRLLRRDALTVEEEAERASSEPAGSEPVSASGGAYSAGG
ncbi:MAG: efflux RND transporter permease subunit [Deltaproteobacteria bacterium]|nr:efflux RND transporter permease subunit [Deltaproteobacteria bacterium]MBW2392813.1 efflux RND transporter permease subunit [Deltaproteobacteria bacterium]